MMTTDRPTAAWRLLTAPTPGPVGVIEITGDVDEALARLEVAPVDVGDVRLRDLAGVDTGLVARWTESCAHLMPHGGPAVMRALLARLDEMGLPEAARPIWPEARDEIEARMLDALARAPSPRAIDLLLDQPRRWREGALEPDAAHSALLDRLLDPPLVVAIGETNIGKSTLVNALAGHDVSIVADEPATTRDHVGVTLDCEGLTVHYVDAPGLSPDLGEIDREAARLAATLATRADLLLLCADALADAPSAPPGFTGPTLTIALRIDRGEPAFRHDVGVCAPDARGLADLAGAIRRALLPDDALEDPRPWRMRAD